MSPFSPWISGANDDLDALERTVGTPPWERDGLIGMTPSFSRDTPLMPDGSEQHSCFKSGGGRIDIRSILRSPRVIFKEELRKRRHESVGEDDNDDMNESRNKENSTPFGEDGGGSINNNNIVTGSGPKRELPAGAGDLSLHHIDSIVADRFGSPVALP